MLCSFLTPVSPINELGGLLSPGAVTCPQAPEKKKNKKKKKKRERERTLVEDGAHLSPGAVCTEFARTLHIRKTRTCIITF